MASDEIAVLRLFAVAFVTTVWPPRAQRTPHRTGVAAEAIEAIALTRLYTLALLAWRVANGCKRANRFVQKVISTPTLAGVVFVLEIAFAAASNNHSNLLRHRLVLYARPRLLHGTGEPSRKVWTPLVFDQLHFLVVLFDHNIFPPNFSLVLYLKNI